MSQDWIALIISFVYVFAMIGIAEGLRKWQNYSVDFTRKFIHIAVGMWAFGTVWLFESRTFAIIPPIAFIFINAYSYWQGTFQAMETGEKGKLGTVYFPLSFAIIVWFLWDRPHLLVAGLMPMTWGDALASVIGQRIGRRIYSVPGSTRSVEGSATMFIASWVATLVALVVFAPEGLQFATALGISAATAFGAALVEAISPWGIDNLSVPAASVLILYLMLP
jgi:dolichol kinase